MFFHSSLSDRKSPQVSRTLLSILAVLNDIAVWVVSTHPQLPSPLNNPLVNVPNAPITIDIIVTFLFHSFLFICLFFVLFCFFNSLARSRYLSFFSYFFYKFYSVVHRDCKVHNFASSLFLLIIIRSGRLAEIRWSVCMSKSQRS